MRSRRRRDVGGGDGSVGGNVGDGGGGASPHQGRLRSSPYTRRSSPSPYARRSSQLSGELPRGPPGGTPPGSPGRGPGQGKAPGARAPVRPTGGRRPCTPAPKPAPVLRPVLASSAPRKPFWRLPPLNSVPDLNERSLELQNCKCYGGVMAALEGCSAMDSNLGLSFKESPFMEPQAQAPHTLNLC